ncbi:MAG TPA: hypothetical protein EYQ20_11925 [candidate division Zixibacteria bacterium]|jgi:formylglycine-generating enzyme required for sulfatase activity|nr:hypothetical protein [candidate division Zixibacteria bacterium]
MHGNAWDWYTDYTAEPHTKPTGPNTRENRIVRDGFWLMDADGCRAADRESKYPTNNMLPMVRHFQ